MRVVVAKRRGLESLVWMIDIEKGSTLHYSGFLGTNLRRPKCRVADYGVLKPSKTKHLKITKLVDMMLHLESRSLL